jgi:hypothetical protein
MRRPIAVAGPWPDTGTCCESNCRGRANGLLGASPLGPRSVVKRCSQSILRRPAAIGALALCVFAAVSTSFGAAGASRAVTNSARYGVPATLQTLTTDQGSPVSHDTETDALVDHAGRIYASTDQWEFANRSPAGQILVKDSTRAPWRVFEQTQGLRVQDTIASFEIPADQGLGSGHSLLITQADLNGHQVLQWLVDDAQRFTPGESFPLPSDVTDVRSFGAHETHGVWSVYAGVEPTGVLRGTWSKARRSLVFSPTPELTVAPSISTGVRTQKVTAFANCGGALYVTINTKLFRRNDGTLLPGVNRWQQVYAEPPVGAYNSGLRGLTCINQNAQPALLFSTEGDGNVYRVGHLPRGMVKARTMLTPVLEFKPVSAVRQMLASEGTDIPETGKGSIQYVIAAYNDFTTMKIDGSVRQVFGFEWGYFGECPATRTCGPEAMGVIDFDAHACFAIRTPTKSGGSYQVRCLSGPQFRPPGRPTTGPIEHGDAFVSIRTIVPSPFGDGRVYYGGYDCNFYAADGTAWVASSAIGALHVGFGKDPS